jgi:hypothetical protein
MNNNSLHVLLVEDNLTDVLLLEEALEETRTSEFALTHVKRLDEALHVLRNQSFDVVLLDLGLPDSQGFETFARMQREQPAIPILILSGLEDETLSIQAVQDGAQDFLVKGKINARMLTRTIRYAIERKRSEQRLMASEMGYRRLFETSQDGIFILNAITGQITDANPFIEKLLGHSVTEFIGKRLWEIAPFRDKAASQAAFRTLQEKSYIRYDALPLMTREGRQANVEFTSNVYDVGRQQVIQCNLRDITKRKQVEVALQESQTHLGAFIQSLDDIIFEFDRQGTYINVWCNDETLLARPKTELIRRSVADIVGQAIAKPFIDAFRRVLDSGQREDMEYELETAGKKRCFLARISPISASDGSYKTVCMLSRDISERKQMEAALRASEARYRMLFESNPQPMWVYDLETLNFMAVNDAAIAHYGYNKDEFLAMTIKDIRPPEDIPALLYSVSNPPTADGKQGIWRHCKKDGTMIEVELTTHELSFEERPARLALALDITTRRVAERALHKANDELELRVMERTTELQAANEELHIEIAQRQRAVEAQQESYSLLQAVTEGTTDCVLVKDLQGRYLMINSAGALRRGKTAAEVIGKLDSDLFSAETARILTEADRRVLAADVTQTFEETTIEDSVTRTHLVTKGPHRNPRGEVIGIVGMARDITERKQAETELQRAKEEADTANLAKSEFLSRMSHELRTPLNAILGFGQILDSEDLDLTSKESVGYILKGGRHLLDLINEVLDIARVEAGRLDMSLESIALNDIVPEVCALVRPLAAERNIHLNESTSELKPLHVLADSRRLKQALFNLLSNAIKYNREGGQVEVSCNQKPGGWATIAVCDSGPGISPLDLSKLFIPFERLSASDSDIEGTGLGLALSQRLVTAMGGTLNVESTVGQGTTFTIELPQATSSEKQLLNLPEVMHYAETNEEVEQTYCVLCIEDNPSNLRLVEAIFRSRPEIKLLTALQGGIGLDLAHQHEPDLILLDLNLPDMHGKEVLSRLQESASTREIPVVVVSADATLKQVERLMAAGARAYLTKPLNISHFLKTLDELLHPTSVA